MLRATSDSDLITRSKAAQNARWQRGRMPDYAAEIEFHVPDFAGAEFRMLSRQLVPLLEDAEGVTHVQADRAAKCIRAGIALSAPSSSTARAKAGSLARALQAQTRRVRSERIALRVEIVRNS